MERASGKATEVLKEKKEKKPNPLKSPFKKIWHLRDKVKGAKPPDDPQQPPKEQKSPLLHKNLSSDAEPLEETFVGRLPGPPPARHGDLEGRKPPELPQMLIKMSNGKMVDHSESTFKSHGSTELSTSPTTSPWSPSSSGYHSGPFPRQGDSRPGYGAPPVYASPWLADSESGEARRPPETLQQSMTYDNLLKEAQTLRRDLEKEMDSNNGSKRDYEQKIAAAKVKIADAQKTKPSAEMYDEIIVSLSQELTHLEKKVREIESRMHPLDRAIADLKDVEDFITDRELDSDGAAMLFEEIMKKMFDDINISGHALTGETATAGRLPQNVLEEMQGKMLTGSLNKTDPGQSEADQEGSDWVAFGNDYDNREKMSSTEGYDDNIKRKRNKDRLQRASRKMSSITEFTTRSRMKNPGRTEAFKFHAFDRADAFRHVEYDPGFADRKDIGYISPALSVTSDQKSTDAVLHPLEKDLWMGLNQGTGATPTPSDVPESLPGSKSVADLQTLEGHPGLQGSMGSMTNDVDEKPPLEKPSAEVKGLTGSASGGSQAGPPGSGAEIAGEGVGPSPPSAQMEDAQTEAPTKVSAGYDALQEVERKPWPMPHKKEAEKDKEPEEDEKVNEGGMAQDLAKVQLKKAEDKPQQPTPIAPVDLENADFAMLAATVLGEAAAGGKAEVGVKFNLNIEEPPPQPKKPSAKPPPPPPKKKGPPPPPKKKGDKKAGGPPPPPGGKRKADEGLQRAPEVIAMFQEMRKALLGSAAKGSGGPKKIGGGDASADPAALMEELAKNSKYAAQVQADVENYREMIENLTKEVSQFEARDMKEMVEFVKRVDAFLAELSDETAVLKQFEWPARYYTMLEAKGLYEELEKMKKTFKPWMRTAKKGAEELKIIQKFMDKSKNRVEVMLRTKDADEKKFKDSKIPWNSKAYTEVKIASLGTLVVYMEIVLEEVEQIMKQVPEESSRARSKAIEKSMGHLTGAINFAFKAHQFAGGFTDPCNAKFAEIASKTRALKSEAAGAAS